MRTTLLAEYRRGVFRIGGELYDSQVYLDKAGSAVTANEVNTLEPVQAYVGADFRDAFGKDPFAGIHMGRMMLNLGSRRLVAADDYRNTTNGYSGVRADIQAQDGTTATLIYTLPQIRLLRLSVECDQASGDGPGQSYHRFDTLFGMRRADLAPAGIYNAITRTNVITPGLRAEMAPSRRLDAFAVYRVMWLADRTDAFSSTGVRDASESSDSFAGHQVEARVRYWLVPERTCAACAGHHPQPAAQSRKGGPSSTPIRGSVCAPSDT